MRAAYVVMEIAVPSLSEMGTEWRSFVTWLGKETVITVWKIAEACNVAEKDFVASCSEDEVETSGMLFPCLCEAFYNGWFSSDSCSCDAGALFAGREMCSHCAGECSQMRKFVGQDFFAGVYPLGREHWWKGVTDGVSAVALWRLALYYRDCSSVLFSCVQCVKATRECRTASL
jgi:hypothetical protein